MSHIPYTKLFKVFVFAAATPVIQAIVLRAYKDFVKYLHKGDLETTDLQNVLELHVVL
jgi:hypothetical protein